MFYLFISKFFNNFLHCLRTPKDFQILLCPCYSSIKDWMCYLLRITWRYNNFDRFIFQTLCLMNRNGITQLKRYYCLYLVIFRQFIIPRKNLKTYSCSIVCCSNKFKCFTVWYKSKVYYSISNNSNSAYKIAWSGIYFLLPL